MAAEDGQAAILLIAALAAALVGALILGAVARGIGARGDSPAGGGPRRARAAARTMRDTYPRLFEPAPPRR